MRKVLSGLATAFVVLLLSWDGGTQLSVSQANAVIGRPGTPGSFAGVHRRVMRRNFGVGWRAGGVAPYRYSLRRAAWGWHRPWVHRHWGWRRPLATAAAVGVVAGAAYGGDYYGGGYGGGCSCGAPGYGGYGSGFGFAPGFGWGAPGLGVGYGVGYGGFGSGFGFRPGFGWGAPGFGWRRGWW